MNLSENRLIATELAGILSDVPLEMLETVYQTAMKNYTDITQPFGAPQLRAAWESLKADMMREVSADQTRSRYDAALAVQSCDHDYVFIAREKSDPSALLGFYECRICLRSKPVFNTRTRANQTQPQLETT